MLVGLITRHPRFGAVYGGLAGWFYWPLWACTQLLLHGALHGALPSIPDEGSPGIPSSALLTGMTSLSCRHGPQGLSL